MKKQIKKFVVLALAVGMLATSVLGVSAGGTRETFDPVRYAKMYPDVVKELGTDPALLWRHHEMFGRYEAREAYEGDTEAKLRQIFDVEDYARSYPDVKQAFGSNKEAMFKHYIAYGLLEARCPSKEVSPAVAKELKKSVEKAMTDAGLKAVPGSLEVVKVLTGDTKSAGTTRNAAKKAEALALQTVLTKVQDVVAKAVTETVQEVQNPKPESSGSDGGSSSSGGGSSSNTQTSQKTIKAYIRPNVVFDRDEAGKITLNESGHVTVRTFTLGNGESIQVTGDGTKNRPYTAVIGNVTKSNNVVTDEEGDHYLYSYAIAVPAEEGRTNRFVWRSEWVNDETGDDGWDNAAGTKNSHTGYEMFEFDSDNGDGNAQIKVAISSVGNKSEMDNQNSTYYQFTVSFAQ